MTSYNISVPSQPEDSEEEKTTYCGDTDEECVNLARRRLIKAGVVMCLLCAMVAVFIVALFSASFLLAILDYATFKEWRGHGAYFWMIVPRVTYEIPNLVKDSFGTSYMGAFMCLLSLVICLIQFTMGVIVFAFISLGTIGVIWCLGWVMCQVMCG